MRRRKRLHTSFGDIDWMHEDPVGTISYLINELFTATIAAGSLNGVVSNGIGTVAQRTSLVTDTNSKLSQAGGVLNFATGGVGIGDPGRWWGLQTRQAGMFVVAEVTPAGIVNASASVGWDTNQAGGLTSRVGFGAAAAIQLVMNGGTAFTVGTFTAATHKTVSMMRTTGFYYFIKGGNYTVWTLLPWDVVSVGDRYPATIALGNVAIHTGDFFRVPEDLVINRLVALLYEDMVKANGALGTSRTTGPDGQPATARLWTGATWAIDTNQAKNTPTQGADMVDVGAGTFAGAGTYAWTAQGLNTIANVGNELQVTYVNNPDGANEYLSNAADLSANLVVGTWYRLDWQSYVNAGASVVYDIYDGVNALLTVEVANVLTSHFQTFRSRSAAFCYIIIQSMGAGEIAYLDNWTLKAITALYANTTDIGVADVIIDETLATVVAGSQLGMRLRVDDIAAPANQLVCYYDKQLGKVMLDQLLAGVWSNLFNTVVAYAANLRLIVQVIGTAVRVYCGVAGSEALVTATVCGAGLVNNTKASMFSTDVGNRIGAFDVRAVGTGGEYAFLNDYLP